MTNVATTPDTLDVVGDQVRIIVDGSASNEAFEMFDFEGPLGSGPPPHAHPWFESYLVIDGGLAVEIDGERLSAGPGTSVVIPAGTLHRYEVTTATARFIVATGGAETSKFFTDLSASAPGAPTPETMPAVIEVAKRHGLTSPLF